MANEREVLRAFGRVVIQGAKSVGTRAAAHGMKSVFRDGARIVKVAEKKLNRVIDRLEAMTAVDPEVDEDEDDTRL